LHSGGGSIQLDHVRDVSLRNNVVTVGGEFSSRSSLGKFQVLIYTAQINSAGNGTAGRVALQHGGDIGLYVVVTGGGEVSLSSAGNVALHGRVDTRGGAGGAFRSRGVNFASDNNAEIQTGGGEFVLEHQGTILLGELLQTAGGAFRAQGLTFGSLDAGAAIRTGGGTASFDVLRSVDLKGALNTAGAPLHIVLHVNRSLPPPVFRIADQLDFVLGSTVTIDMDGTPIGGTSFRLARVIQALRFTRVPTDVRLIDTALGEADFLAQLTASGTTGLDVLLTRSR
jgi:hypothetical protein